MSVRVMAQVWSFFPRGGSDLLCMLALADWSDDEARCYPSMAAVSKKVRLSRSQTQRVVHGLINDDFLTVTENGTGGAPGRTPRYRINLDKLTGRMGATGSADATGRMGAQEGPHGRGETGRMGATRTIIEPPVPTTRVLGGFAQFWCAYPKKKSKGQAEKAWAKLKPSEQLTDLILKAVERATNSVDWKKQDGQFIPYPASWLNARAWEDEPVRSQGRDASGKPEVAV